MAGNPLCHFEFMTLDVDKAKEFYSKVFDWQFEAWPGPMKYITIKTGTEPEGGMMKKPDEAPMPALNVYFLVGDIEQTLEKVKEAGGNVIVVKTPIPDIGYFAMFMDPDNIAIGLFEKA